MPLERPFIDPSTIGRDPPVDRQRRASVRSALAGALLATVALAQLIAQLRRRFAEPYLAVRSGLKCGRATSIPRAAASARVRGDLRPDRVRGSRLDPDRRGCAGGRPEPAPGRKDKRPHRAGRRSPRPMRPPTFIPHAPTPTRSIRSAPRLPRR